MSRLLDKVRARGIHLFPEGNEFRFRAPRGALTPELKNELSRHKAEIITELETAALAPKVEGDVVELAQREFKRLSRRLSRIMRPGYLPWTSENEKPLYDEIQAAYDSFDTAERVECLKAGRVVWCDYRRLMLAWARLHVRAIKHHRNHSRSSPGVVPE